MKATTSSSDRERAANLRARRRVVAAVRALARQGDVTCRELPDGDLLVESKDGRVYLLEAQGVTRFA